MRETKSVIEQIQLSFTKQIGQNMKEPVASLPATLTNIFMILGFLLRPW
jgi:hypothetical protein